jgi:hypothetical protein
MLKLPAELTCPDFYYLGQWNLICCCGLKFGVRGVGMEYVQCKAWYVLVVLK